MSQSIALESVICGVGHEMVKNDADMAGYGGKSEAPSQGHERPDKATSGRLRRVFSLSGQRKSLRVAMRKFPLIGGQHPATSDDVEKCPDVGEREPSGDKRKLFRTSSVRKFISRIAQQITSLNIAGVKPSVGDRVPPLGGYQWPPDQTPGVTGLKNHGNTCFMNAVLQCLSHTDLLAEYFVLDQYKVDLKRRNKINSRKFGTKGELTEQLALILKALWTCRYSPHHSTSFKAAVDRHGSQFRSSTQHDAQEFLFWLLDKVHEDLNTATKRKYKAIKNTYGRPDEIIAAETLANHIRCNNSFVQAVFQAQFRSSLTCPRCHKQSNTFDPFHCISVQLPQIVQQNVIVTVLYATQHPRQVKLGLGIPPGSPFVTLREQLHLDTGIASERMVLMEINEQGFSRVFCDSDPISVVADSDMVYCIEMPEASAAEEKDVTVLLCAVNGTRKADQKEAQRFGAPMCVRVKRDITHVELQRALIREMQPVLKDGNIEGVFRIRLQDPLVDPDTYLESTVEHPLFTENIELMLSVVPPDTGPANVRLMLEWETPEEHFSDMTDPIVEHASVAQVKERSSECAMLTLEQCLDHYTKAETLSAEDAWRCPHCQKYLPVVKTLGLWSLPDILVIHFKRFRQQQLREPQAAKLTTMVKFPLNGFDMSPHLARSPTESGSLDPNDGDNWSPWKLMKRRDQNINGSQKDTKYDLYAVCYHQGDTLETGHYTAACRNPYDQQWYMFDDQNVARVNSEAIEEEIINNEAYILFYQRRKIDLAECSGGSSSSGDHWVSRITATTAPSTVAEESKKIAEKSVESAEVKKPVESETVKEEQMKPQESSEESTVLVTEAEVTEDAERQEMDTVQEEAKDIEEKPLEEQKESPVQEDSAAVKKEDSVESLKGLDDPDVGLVKEDEEKFYNSVPESRINWLKAFDDNYERRRSLSSTGFLSSAAKCDSLRRSTGPCSKDTLLYIDQQSHPALEDEGAILATSHSLWITPVASHKLISVSPKN
ncbi:ubiquitin carboxyl-terminal hydrolase 31 [Phlebotomus argentipes]|uniref:ubiquitin carboxyl-terminal hydrolase 31 n=1 Tax=Phlebotomus argentipes TaxID=94469 RepID=UPI002892E475|nr:ubiquitin carboxyl-terminal hydrolase 31 [Phlebotomus argentipes]